MTEDLENTGLRPAVIDGVRQDDHYEVIWRGLTIGRILKQPGNQHWWWGCNVYGQPPTADDRGSGINFKDCQVRFKLAWTRIRASLTEEDIAIATRHAEEFARQHGKEGQPTVPETLQALENKRAAPRQRVLKSGIIEFNGGTIDCVVRNVSQTGAALEVASSLGLPSEFNLRISGNQTNQPCQVVWRRENRIGVAFK